MSTNTSTLDFGTEFQKLIRKYGITQKKLSEQFGMKQSTLSRVLKGSRGGDFEKIYKIVKYVATLSPKIKVEKLMLLYIRDLTNYDNVKVAMEYCDTHNFLGQLQKLCEYFWSKAKESNELKAWADLYNLSIQRKLGKISLTDWYNKLMEIEPSCKESEIYRSLRALEHLNQEQNYREISDNMKMLQENISHVENTYIRFSFGIRLGEFLQAIYVRSGKFDEAEELALQTLGFSIGKGFDAFATITLAERNIQDKSKIDIAIQHFEKAIEIYEEMNRLSVASLFVKRIELIKLLHSVDIPLEDIKHKQNIAFKHILDGNTAHGMKLLDELDIEEGKQEAIRDFMRGKATGDRGFYWKALSTFMKRNDRLYGYFPMKELLKLGEHENGVLGLYNIYETERGEQ
ncbi:AimR family lysis-lysogeny pheromone receptor [Cytobacillus sp. IB215665]|uniref:AimR family lysis-lysogeny pheromone receptor n=1 Tax=Cytobacillus sp. IB215665 TaxID=3097357 RepID=UPI002A0AEBB1|nr:AimR family lysis-lysogeny pheromone receptor [Cytobacillus sp. IB215665]MDX8367820.1 AimR family lysis-lysogeny pheromone receptor [Cytobacillus sp. IB215665]